MIGITEPRGICNRGLSMSDQQVFFVFKLRKNIALEGDLLLSKLELESFLPNAVITATDISTLIQEVPHMANLQGFGVLASHARTNGKQAYTACGPLALLPLLVRRVSFIQRIYCLTRDSEEIRSFLTDSLKDLGPVITYTSEENCLLIQAVPHYALIELTDVVAKHSRSAVDTKQNLTTMLNALMDRTSDRHAVRLADIALSTKSTTAHLSHDVHYYKAKFFPRLARSVLNICTQYIGGGEHRAIDNFAGSGTALLEASILDIPSVGLDIDPLSVMIAQAKLEVAHLDSSLLSEEVGRLAQMSRTRGRQLGLFDTPLTEEANNGIVFPAWLMKNRKMTLEIAAQLSNEIGVLRTAVTASNPQIQNLLRVFISDAIARKIRMRFMGTGVGRFSLTFTHASLIQMFLKSIEHYVKVIATYEWLQENIQLRFADAQVLTADTRSMPDGLGQFDILVTSPPYLPASSGRESYTKARAPSLIALGLRSHEDVDDLVDDTIGSMNGGEVDTDELMEDERNVVEWLRGDELREIKAEPVARYFLDMRQAFMEMYRVLRPGALAVVVSGRTSTFYQYSTRTALYVVNCAEILANEARRAGFEVEALHHIQLFKSNMNARPRSLDDYYETLIMLRRPTD
jgi:DNA modification methylase